MKTTYGGLIALLILAAGCDDTRRDWTVCSAAEKTCLDGYTCNTATWNCVPKLKDAGVDGLNTIVDAPSDYTNDAHSDARMDVAQVLDVPAKQDRPLDGSAGGDSVLGDAQLPDTLSPDTLIPDAAGSCLVDKDCTGVTGKPVCVNFQCVACKDHTQCNNDAGVPFCSSANSCVSCATVDAGCSGAISTCDPASGRCVECLKDDGCGSPDKKFCRANMCVGCQDTQTGQDGKTACTGTTPACDSNSGRCVECIKDDGCTSPDKKFCRANKCVGCQDTKTGDDDKTACSGKTPVCNGTTGRCVECVEDGDCKSDKKKAFCRSNTCVGCQTAAAGGASVCSGSTPACAASGACVECVQSTDCLVAEKPICDTAATTCKHCSEDSECAGKPGNPPVLCMSHQDRRCASEAETLFVDNTGACSNSSTGGTAMNPYCNLQNAIDAATAAKRVIVVKGANVPGFFAAKNIGQISIVGKENVSVRTKSLDLATPAMDISGTTNLFVRDVSVVGATGVNSIGIRASSGTTLRLAGVKVINNGGGGILIDGASFNLEDVLVKGNGQGIDGAIQWSGVYFKSVPANGTKNLSHLSIIQNTPNGLNCATPTMTVTADTAYIAANLLSDILNCPSSVTSCSPPAAGSCGSSLTAP